ncbi:MAG: hypothetical protein AB7N76_27755 [Planctomycetota bacterium]
MNEINEFQRRGDNLYRELGLGLEKALMAYGDVNGPARTFDQGYEKLAQDMRSFAKLSPNAATWVEAYLAHLRKSADELVRRARNAAQRRGEVDGSLAKKYNETVGGALANAPGQVKGAVHGQVERLVRQLIDQALPSQQVPGDVRATMTRELTKWLEDQGPVEDAYFVVERTVSEVATWLHRRLTIQGEIKLTKETLIQNPKVTKDQADAADQRVGELAKRSQELDALIARRIEESTLRVKGNFSFRPNLVLDPAHKFLKSVELKAGIQISQGGVKVDLGTKLVVVDPLLATRNLDAQAYLNAQIPSSNLSFGVQGQTHYQPGQGFQGYQVKAALTWRF